MPFLDERFPIDISYGSSFNHSHNVNVTTTQSGDEFRSLVHPFVKLEYNVIYEARIEKAVKEVLNLYDRANGKFRSFRVKDLLDFTTHNNRDTPTALDQPMFKMVPSGKQYRLTKWYGNPTTPGCARRFLKKPVAGTVKIAFNDVVQNMASLQFDYTTGILTMVGYAFATPIFGATISSATTVTVGAYSHPFVNGDQVTLSGNFGIPALVGKAANVTVLGPDSFRLTYSVAHGATGAYTVGGVATSAGLPLPAKVTAGCEFDVPCRFDADFKGQLPSWEQLQVGGLPIVEVFNP